ncbi:heat shock protein 70 (HSP70)-interacting protein, putative [Ixodes scapularis]|uniref:Heat shock protein 70 (HSP70)-interacting protein, putative n=1 Tax=Ixodes scapularis TaxID=6945 RepID=B7PA62_IXOSC|nr:heat shock protein 70 (HSP70)-interacting protein, putative [Ixodes scapularis]|eukprot:XP_002406287.1 heat shock protein 70 (HSP70)-interacting protein, putative [Ixodes scapularis]
MCEVFIKAFDLEDWYNANPLECSCSNTCNDNVGQGRDTGCQTSNSAVAASQTSPVRNNKGKSTAAVQTLPVENSNVCKTTNHNEGATAPGSHTGALPKKPQTPKKLSKKAAKKQRRKQRQKQQMLGMKTKTTTRRGLSSALLLLEKPPFWKQWRMVCGLMSLQAPLAKNMAFSNGTFRLAGSTAVRMSGSSSDLEDEKTEVEEEDLDLNSAFVVMSLARKAAKASGAVPKKSVKVREDAVAQSRKLAEEGFELCHLSRYKDAISMFSQAIKLCPDDHTSYGNRSFCYCILERYDKALYDAEKAVSLQPTLAKGYFRRGKAQLGLQKYREAAESFKTVLSIDPECHEAFTELHNVHIYELMGMGFTQEQADWALTMGGEDIQSAVDALCGNGNYKADTKMNPGNLDGLCSIWVGNVRPEVTEKMLRNLFHK